MSRLYAQQASTHRFAPPPARRHSQRTCACGRPIGPTGECAECRRRRLLHQPQRGHMDAAAKVSNPHGLQRQFGRMPIHVGGDVAHHEQAAREDPIQNQLPDEEGGEVVELVTGGSSKCNLAGDSQVINNRNDECTRPCTQEHEENHVSNRSDCCERARSAYHAADDASKRSETMRKWNRWVRENRAVSECSAYGVSVQCAQRMWGEQNCDSDSPANAECCTQIESYRAHVTERRDHYCGEAGGASRTDCPFSA